MKYITGLSTGLACVALFVAAFHVIYDVAMRTLGTPIIGTIEYVTYWWMPIIVVLSMAGACYAGEHLQATLLIDALPKAWQSVFGIIIPLVFFVVIAVMSYFLWMKGFHAQRIDEASLWSGLKVLMWPTRFVVALGMSILALQILVDIAQRVRDLFKGSADAPVVHEHEGVAL